MYDCVRVVGYKAVVLCGINSGLRRAGLDCKCARRLVTILFSTILQDD